MGARIEYPLGHKFPNTRLTYQHDMPKHNKRRQALFFCDCGEVIITDLNWVKFLDVTSCGCYRSELVTKKNTKHSQSSRTVMTGAYRSWAAMHNRCKSDPYYTNRTVCDRWSGKDGFANFYADMGDRPDGLTIERINNEGNYEPSNCKWATWSEQNLNK